ncbi:hypothetical protein [Kitasatospora sp. NPDC057198]|uniref:hypothetical protein n=1 Tax=Kitasatospora sp. NPDC057198 TaxID=3346046 RepID=UPI00362FBA1C
MNKPLPETALLLRAAANMADIQSARLPRMGPGFPWPDPAAVSRQISELGSIVNELGDEYLFLAVASHPAPQAEAVLAAEAFANAAGSTASAAAELGGVGQQLATLARTAGGRSGPDVDTALSAAADGISSSLDRARGGLADAAKVLRACAETIAPALVELRQAAYTRAPHATAPQLPPPDRTPKERAADPPDRSAPTARVDAALSRSTVQPSTSQAAPAASSDAVATPALPISSAHRGSRPWTPRSP